MSPLSEIDSRRAEHGIRQAVLCEKAGVHPTTYSAIKSRRRGAHTRTLEKLANALDELTGAKTNGKGKE